MLKPIEWVGSAVRLLDQTKLPGETVYVEISGEKQMWDAIRRLVVRGAPAIGIAAAFGAYLGIAHATCDVHKRLDEVCDYLSTSRPTAVNLFWALKRVQEVGHHAKDHEVAARVLAECLEMIEEDHRVCRAIGQNGLRVLGENLKPQISNLQSQVQILTHCNA